MPIIGSIGGGSAGGFGQRKGAAKIETNFLVIAGGGAASSISGPGGGGAGGYRNSYNSESSGGGGSAESALGLTPGETYTITVGAGGASNGGATDVIGNAGNDSSISGTGITTITSIGGGVGGFTSGNFDGGSGGGGRSGPGGSGTANQGFNGGSGANDAGGGGGGAGAVGVNGVANTTPGNGGAGVASTITGSSVTRGGGGGGGTFNGTTSSGGSGGGGNGGKQSPATDATAGGENTGGGGGAKNSSPNLPTGGSGVIILRLPTADYSSTTTGSPTVTTDGTDTILVFNASGSYTAQEIYMAHFAKINNSNIVEKVIVVSNDVATTEQAGVDFINNLYKTNDVWKQTSYNTYGGVHKLGGTPFRKNYAGIGYIYDQTRDAFYLPKPYDSWTLNEDTCSWEAPVAKPDDRQDYIWNETIQNWDLINNI